MAPICANKSDRTSYMNEIDGFSVLLTFPKPKANRSRKPRQFHDFSLLQGVASLRPITRRNMQALPPRRVTVLQRSDKNRLKKFTGTQAKVQGLQKGARQLKSRKPLRKTQGQASFLDRHVRNMENRRGPLNRRIKRYSILQQLNFGATSCVLIGVLLTMRFRNGYTNGYHISYIGLFYGKCRCFVLPMPAINLTNL